MTHEPIPPHPKNAPGPFYVENDSCLCCSAPEHEAPDLISSEDYDEAGELIYHCHFKKQPETPEEVERAIMACYVSCIRAVRYGGNNPKILKRFRQLGRTDSCDVWAGLTLAQIDQALARVGHDPLGTPLPPLSDGPQRRSG